MITGYILKKVNLQVENPSTGIPEAKKRESAQPSIVDIMLFTSFTGNGAPEWYRTGVKTPFVGQQSHPADCFHLRCGFTIAKTQMCL